MSSDAHCILLLASPLCMGLSYTTGATLGAPQHVLSNHCIYDIPALEGWLLTWATNKHQPLHRWFLTMVGDG